MPARLPFLLVLLASLVFAPQLGAQPNGVSSAIPPLSPAQLRALAFNDLFAQLRAASDPDLAAAFRAEIERLWSRADSPTANLLMTRANSLLQAKMGPEASALLDRIVVLYPDWAFAWRRRAQSAILLGDNEGAMLDLDRALAIEPRDFPAMIDLAELMRGAGRAGPALALLRRALALDPQNEPVVREADELRRQVEGEKI